MALNYEDWNTADRMYRRYVDGVIVEDRPYTPTENAITDAALAMVAAEAAHETSRAAIRLIITDLKLEKDRVQPVIDLLNSATVTTPQIKDLARASKRIADAAIELARFVQNME